MIPELKMDRFLFLKREAFFVVTCGTMMQMQKAPGEDGLIGPTLQNG
jgi:hypothetical protein